MDPPTGEELPSSEAEGTSDQEMASAEPLVEDEADTPEAKSSGTTSDSSSSSSSGDEEDEDDDMEDERVRLVKGEDEEVDVEEDDDDEEDMDDEDEAAPELDAEAKKRALILERCRAIEQDNEHLTNRTYEVKALIQQEKRKKRLLMMKLDQIGDNYRHVAIVMPPPEVESHALALAGGGAPPKRKPGRPPKGDKTAKPKNPVGRPPKKPRDPKDPNLPKRPQNPFFQFCQEQRTRVHREYQREHNVELSKKELTKVLGQRWQEMGAEQKQIYNLLFEEEKLRYTAHLSQYQEKRLAQSKVVKPPF